MAGAKKNAKASPAPAASIEAKVFPNKDKWAAWLEANHAQNQGLWLRIAKKGSKLPSVTYHEALDSALRYGWIDGQKRPESEDSWLQRFLPRSPKSLWSKINRDKALALIAAGQMKAAGLKAIEDAKLAGRWDAAYDPPSKATAPSDFLDALDASPSAKSFFGSLDKANRYAIIWRIQTAKNAETRARKIAEFVGMLEREEKIHN